jgi:hypothetical protein
MTGQLISRQVHDTLSVEDVGRILVKFGYLHQQFLQWV